MPAGSKVIIFGFGLSGESIDIADLIEFGYYHRGFAFFSPAGSAASWLPVVFPASMNGGLRRNGSVKRHCSAPLGTCGRGG
jgi:hypothetical protein